jgi:hypothetical protein
MKKSDILEGQIYQQIKPSKHTEKLEKVEVLSLRSHYESAKKAPYKGKRNYTYVYTKTCNGQYYPDANKVGLNEYPHYLDGLVCCMLLSDFKRNFKLIN